MKANIRTRNAAVRQSSTSRVPNPQPVIADDSSSVVLTLLAIALCIAAAVFGYGLMP